MLASARQFARERHTWSRLRRGLLAAVCISGGLIFLAGCVNSPSAESPAPDSPKVLHPDLSGGPPIATPTAVISPTAETVGEVVPPDPATITLTMWTTEAFSPLQDDAGSQVLKKQVADFSAQYPQAAVNFVLKKPYGEGGISNFLQTTSAVVPQALPDLAIIDVEELPKLAALGLLRPLDSLVSSGLQTSLFPFARKSCTVSGQLMCVPFEADLIHLAYDTAALPTPPLTWDQVLSGTATYAFPAGGEGNEQVNDAFWLQYLAAGGSNPASQPALNEDVLAQVFQFYKEGVNKQVIPQAVLDYRTEADSWSAYLSGKAAMANASSLRYLNSRALLGNSSFAQVPTRDGRPSSVARGWAIAVLTADKARQEASARFLEWLLRPEYNGPWTQATHRVPTTRPSLDTWDKADRYTSFISGLLEVAEPYPSGSVASLAAKQVQRSIREVVQGSTAPRQAAAGVVNTLEK